MFVIDARTAEPLSSLMPRMRFDRFVIAAVKLLTGL